jgi:hypothetical protein
MNKTKMVLCALLAVMLIIPLAISIAPAVRADSGEPPAPPAKADSTEPQGGAEATLYYWSPPDMGGYYYMKGKCIGYDWKGDKVAVWVDGWMHIDCQAGHKVELYWNAPAASEPGMAPIGFMPQSENTMSPQMEPPGISCPSANGYVGCRQYTWNANTATAKYKNKPRLSMSWVTGTYGAVNYQTGTLNARVKLDSKTGAVKSIKGIVEGWALWSPYVSFDSSFSWVQYEFKFTATPAD